ncbi:hypothetical protein B0T25DRAFT_150811 [Lasiosphaeria hispida]|uniref:Uncharacterized protein n=1 Tax=Lasiosphaeria hispida TaxID=260671 RepID=A0AAJ0HLR4_9PEZI|nr:hypothetical protein B0T25DRAFT_150811 [Lasiosphaeria hispida]
MAAFPGREWPIRLLSCLLLLLLLLLVFLRIPCSGPGPTLRDTEVDSHVSRLGPCLCIPHVHKTVQHRSNPV